MGIGDGSGDRSTGQLQGSIARVSGKRFVLRAGQVVSHHTFDFAMTVMPRSIRQSSPLELLTPPVGHGLLGQYGFGIGAMGRNGVTARLAGQGLQGTEQGLHDLGFGPDFEPGGAGGPCGVPAKRMLGDKGGAEDLVHDVFMEVWRNCDNYDPHRATVRTWILVRLRSRALDRLRSASVRREVTTDDVAPTEAAPMVEDPALAPDRAAVVQALADLPEEQRLVIELSYFHGLSSSEIAERMGSPLGTVKSRTAAGLAKIRSAMQIGAGQ